MAPDSTVSSGGRPAILSFHPGALTPFALKLKPEDTLESVKLRAAKKLAIPKAQVGGSLESGEKGMEAKYLWADVWYGLDDEDDFDALLDRARSVREIPVSITHPSIPAVAASSPPMSARSQPSHYSPSTYRLGDGFAEAGVNAGYLPPSASQCPTRDDESLFSASMPGLNVNSRRKGAEHSIHLIASSELGPSNSARSGTGGSIRSGQSGRTQKTQKTQKTGVGKTKSISGMSGMTSAQSGSVQGVPAHKIAFEKFHSELGVRTFIGSIGPIENVRMMMKPGHRACYMSRSFALAHNFIPRDAAPGFYGFSGITNLGSWPIKIGQRTVEQQVMLVENSYFPVILGRSFMEKRGVKTDPLVQTSVVFMDTGEAVECDIVVVKDSNGNPIPVS